MISERLEKLLVEIWGSTSVGWIWMQAPNQELDGFTPFQIAVERGCSRIVEDMLEEMIPRR